MGEVPNHPNGSRREVNVHVVAAHQVLRQSIVELVRSLGLTTSSLEQADVVVVDLCGELPPYPSPTALPTLALICADEDDAADLLRRGYKGYLRQGAEAAQLKAALLAIHRGENWAERKVLAKALSATSDSLDRSGLAIHKLTSREQEVLHLLVKGLSNRDIAARLNITEKTVKGHASSLYSKLGVSDRRDLIFQFSRATPSA